MRRIHKRGVPTAKFAGYYRDAIGQDSYDGYERLTLVQHYTWRPNPQCNCGQQWNAVPWADVNYSYDLPVTGDYPQNYTWGRLSGVTFGSSYTSDHGMAFAYEYSYTQAGRVEWNRMLASSGATALDLRAQYTWDNNGRMTSVAYPSGRAMDYQYDNMSRPVYLSHGGSTVDAYATYGPAGRLLTVGGSETSGYLPTVTNQMNESFTYNSMLQLTGITGSASTSNGGPWTTVNIDLQYVYNTGHNNGRVAQTIDHVLGETVNYTYDYLHRLSSATASNGSWGEAYAYDGFGNLTGKTPTVGSAPAFTGNVGSNNTGGALSGGQWDVENRLMSSQTTSAKYAYDPWGRRIWAEQPGPAFEGYFYGASGQKLESYSCTLGGDA